MKWTVQTLREGIEAGRITRRSLLEHALERASDPKGVGALAFTQLFCDQARAQAHLQDNANVADRDLSGVPISVKDLFDVEGQVTMAGSTVLRNAQPARQDATAVARLKNSGAILIGRTNMTEFAYSGVGINPHYGTPPNPYDRRTLRIPGGSTSGGAVSVSDGMAVAALGSDTGGSVRIPAALCGLTGFKPTKGRIPTQGIFPLSPTLDSVGVIANTVNCCHAVDAALRQESYSPLQERPLAGATFALAPSYFTDGMDASVADAFDRSATALSRLGAHLVNMEIPELLGMQQINSKGGFAAAESFHFHQQLHLEMSEYDPRVRERILRGNAITDAKYLEMLGQRHANIASFSKSNLYDGLLCPTVPIVAPAISELKQDTEFHQINLLLLRNPAFANFFDLCAVSLPCHQPGDAPVGLMIMGRSGSDATLLSTALSVENAFRALYGVSRPQVIH